MWANIDMAVRNYDKMVVICSSGSLDRPGVLREIERALQKEDDIKWENAGRSEEARQAGEEPRLLDEDVLCPVRLDDYIFDTWEHSRKADVLAKHVGDFEGWSEDEKKYQESLSRLLHALDPKSWSLGGQVLRLPGT